MNIFAIPVVAIIFSLFLNGCSQTTIMLADSNGEKNAVVLTTDAGELIIDKPYQIAKITSKKSKPVLDTQTSVAEIKEKFTSTINVTPKKPVSILLYFKHGTSDLTAESIKKLPEVRKRVDERQPCDVNVIGHTDTSGNEKYNIRVSLKRAQVIETWLRKQNMNIQTINVESYGESDLLVKTKDGVSERRNRRVEILIR